ncbi:MAG: 5-formyltetrahydrofolate cyclo-ligase, partial [Nitriliruptorales bacterium]|nr:5-formyltetrahydrofolate cyclo-ligase [Nitriliruptorales bacterium]
SPDELAEYVGAYGPRRVTLEDGKLFYMAVPRLRDEQPFFLLDPDRLEDTPRKASSIKGAERNAAKVAVDELEPVDLVVTGCVAVTPGGARLGKGGGFSDLEFAVASAAGLITDDTIVATTVHEVQILDDGEIPMTSHDVPIDLIVTPEQIIEVQRAGSRNVSIEWDELTEEKIDSIPLLRRLVEER